MQKITQNYSIKGNGVLEIDEHKNLMIYLEDRDTPVNLADLLTDYDGYEVNFSFVYNGVYEADEQASSSDL